jgi:hypothetical protein
MEVIWTDGVDNYKENKIITDPITNKKVHHIILKDVPTDNTKSYLDMSHSILANKGKLNVLLSGGQDSELLLRTIMSLGLDYSVTTMKLVVDDCIVNTQDLYYSEMFCRENNVKQNIITLDVYDFFESKKYLNYLIPYSIIEPHVATHFWMLEQCDDTPVFAGDYSWPWIEKSILSPHRLEYSSYSRFMLDNNINGISSFLNHSLELNMHLIDRHYHYYNDTLESGRFKSNLYSSLGVGEFVPRLRNSGWEGLTSKLFKKNKYKLELIKKLGVTPSTIFWGEKIKTLLKSDVNQNNIY